MAIRSVVNKKPKKASKKEVDRTDYSKMVKKIKPIEEVEQPMTALIYGKSGTGKTAFSATFPRPILILDIREKGTETIANEKGIDVVPVDNWSEFEQMYWYLKEEDHGYKTIVLDQISALQGVAMDQVREDAGLEPSDKMHKGQWSTISGLMQTWLEHYRNLRDDGLNVVFIAHDRMRGGDDDDGAEEGQIAPNVGARLMPSVSGFVNGAVSVIGNTFIRERFKKVEGKKIRKVDYCMRIGPHAYYDTKIRRPKGAGPLPEFVVNPSHAKLLAISRGEDIDVKAKKVEK